MPKRGGVYDRGLYHEFNDHPLRTMGAAWVEPTGAAVLFDDFLGDTLSTDLWQTDQVGTGGLFAIQATADGIQPHGGWIRATTGSTASDEVRLNGEIIWRADRAGDGMLVFQVRYAHGAAGQGRLNLGFTDAKSEVPFSLSAGPALNSVATDAATILLDEAINDNVYGVCVDTDTDGSLNLLGSAPTLGTSAAHTARIEIDSAGNCYYYFLADDLTSHRPPAFQARDTVGVSPDVHLCPVVAIETTSAAGRRVDVDYILVACGRG